MPLQLKKVAPASIPTTKRAPKQREYICFCKTIRPVAYLLRLVGLFPVISKHQDGKCIFQKSWLLYSHTVAVVCYLAYEIISDIDFVRMTRHTSLLPLLDEITNDFYGCYVVFATLLVIIKVPKYVETLNKFSEVFNEDVLCTSARKMVLLTQFGSVALVLVALLLQVSAFVWIHSSDSYETNFTVGNLFLRITQNISLIFYAQFCTFIDVIVGALACFEKLTLNALGYVPVQSMKGVNELNNTRYFLGIFPITLCKTEHQQPAKFSFLNAAGVVENLRIAHEELCLCIYNYNDCMDPVFLCHVISELVLLIVHWYAVIVYMVYSFKSPAADAIHVLNCVFVLFHAWGLLAFLKVAQQMKNMIEGLISFLLDYSTKISNEEEHLQVRFFIEKLKQHRPFSASGMFNIDLGIAGPISANILTYVLVALQFDILDE